MKRANLAWLFPVVLVCILSSRWGNRSVLGAGQAASHTPEFPVSLSSALPFDVDNPTVRHLVDVDHDIPAAHAHFDILAWQAFIALNWPAEADGSPSKTRTITDVSGPRVWDFWRPSDTIFRPEGEEPVKWSYGSKIPLHYGSRAAWRQHTTAASNLEAFSGPLVDQNGSWVRYQIRVNPTEFDYIVKNTLYSQDGQQAFSESHENNQVEMPVNQGKTHGSIEIKLAWKEMGSNDDPSRFYTVELSPDLSEPGPRKIGKARKYGLVGMHIAMRTASSPEWIWSTFEQIDNVRSNQYAGQDGHDKMSHPSFFDPDKLQPINVLPAANAVQDPDTGDLTVVKDTSAGPNKWVESLTKTPVQVQRVHVPTQLGLNPLDETLAAVTRTINGQVQKLLASDHSVFQYYELIDTQWPVHPNAPAFAGGQGSAPESIRFKTPGEMLPVFLVNTTMETYFQKGLQQAGSLEQDDRLASTSPPIDASPVAGTESCVGCHYSSGITIGFKKDLATGRTIVDKNGLPTPVYGENNHFGKTGNASFSWMLQLEPRAKPRKTSDPDVIVE